MGQGPKYLGLLGFGYLPKKGWLMWKVPHKNDGITFKTECEKSHIWISLHVVEFIKVGTTGLIGNKQKTLI